MAKESLILSLTKPVVRALSDAGVTQEELLGGAIQLTNLSWQAPPLICDEELNSASLSFYIDGRCRVQEDALYLIWQECMIHLRNGPYKVATEEGYRGLSHAILGGTQGERLLRLTPPVGFPSHIDEYAGVTLSLECAHLLSTCTPVRELVSDDDNYYVVTQQGYEVGVRDGLPILGADQWDLPVSGMVQGLLRVPRGPIFTGCDYDLIAKLRSTLHVHGPDKVKDFEGVDLALQILRILANGKHLNEVQQALSGLHRISQRRQIYIRALEEAVELSKLFTISDRSRVQAIFSLLVPDFMSLREFRTQIYHKVTDIPPTMSQPAFAKLQQALQSRLDAEKAKL